MKKSKNWLLYRFLIFLIFITIILCLLQFENKNNSLYYGNELFIIGYINDIKIDGNRLTIHLIGKEKIIAKYYIKKEAEKTYFENNYHLGDYIKIEGILKKPLENRNFNLFNYKNYLLSKKIHWIFNVESINKIANNNKIRYQIKSLLIKRINSIKDSSAYLKAFILGKTFDIDSETLNSYQINGINHLLAISGMHITLLSGIILKILNFFKYKKINYIITILLLLFYLFIIDFQSSAVRATLLFLALTINNILRFNKPTIFYLILILCILLLYNPFYIYDLGFVFSFTISFYLVIFQSLINQYNNYIVKVFMVSLIAFLASIPILINNFFQVNLLSPLINIIFVPFVSLIIFPLSLLTFILPFLDTTLSFLLNILENLSRLISNFDYFIITLKKVPFIIVIFYYIIITIILISFKYKKYYSIFILLFILLIHNNVVYFNRYPKLTIIDVGQGDSILIELPFNRGNILVDTGGKLQYSNEKWMKTKSEFSSGINVIIPYLKSIGVKKIDYLIITHGDVDHIGSAIDVINNFNIKNVIFNSGYNNKNETNVINELKKIKITYYQFNKNVLNINGYNFFFLNNQDKENENEDSLIIYTKLNNKNILLMGDAGRQSEDKLVNEYILPKMDILKIGHHGSKNSTSDKLLNDIEPKIALISVGLDNKFNHPSEEVIMKLKSENIKHYITSINGTIRITLKDKIIIDTCLSGTLMH